MLELGSSTPASTSLSRSAIYVVGDYSKILRFRNDTLAEISPDDPMKEPKEPGVNRHHCRMERFASDPSLVGFSASSDPYDVSIFNIETRTRVVTMNPSLHDDHTDGLAVIDDELTRRTTRPLVVSGDDNSLGVIWDANTGKVVAIRYICRLLYVSDWNQSLFACGNMPDCIFRLDLERALTAVDGWNGSHIGQVNDMSPDVDKSMLASVALDKYLHLWDIRGNGKTSVKLHGFSPSVLCLPDRHQVLVGSKRCRVQLFDLRNTSRVLSSFKLDVESIRKSVYALERISQNSFAGIIAMEAAFLASIKPSDEMEIMALRHTPPRRFNYGIRMLGDRLDDGDSGVQDELERIQFLMQRLFNVPEEFGCLFVVWKIIFFRWSIEIESQERM